MTMKVKEVSITAIDFNNLKPEDVFKWLDQWGFKRFVAQEYIIPSKSVDPRLIWPNESPEGLYHAIIVPDYHKGKFLWMIDLEMFEKIKSYFESAFATNEDKEGHGQ